MDDDDFFGEMFTAAPERPAYRFQKVDLLVLAASFAHGVVSAAATTLGDLSTILAMHANYEIEQDRFHQQAAREIETLIAGEADADHE